MAYTNAYGGYSVYKQVGVKTASQGKLVVMLYEGAISAMEKAIGLIGAENKIQAKNIEAFGNHLQKVMDIVTELECSLDMDRGGDIAQNLMALYVWFNKEILAASMSHDKTSLENILRMLKELHSSWVVAANSEANTVSSNDRPSLNIQG